MKKLSLVLVVLMLSVFTFAQDETEPAKECCLANQGYQGVCRVTPGEGESCDSILNYLNTPGTVGKTYCGGSKIRGGWTAVSCEEESN